MHKQLFVAGKNLLENENIREMAWIYKKDPQIGGRYKGLITVLESDILESKGTWKILLTKIEIAEELFKTFQDGTVACAHKQVWKSSCLCL